MIEVMSALARPASVTHLEQRQRDDMKVRVSLTDIGGYSALVFRGMSAATEFWCAMTPFVTACGACGLGEK